ncbi:MAG TPA: hypothetical protein VHO25_09700, partial [Polyangiaceae bacterium]|nr:hypothetical protein [Polyangiaceae bacterium]
MQFKIRNPLFSLIIAGYCLACSSSSDPNTPTVNGTGGTPAAGGTGGTTIGNAGAATGSSGTTNAGAGGSAGTTTLPAAGSNAGGAGGDTSVGGTAGAAQAGAGGESAAGSGGVGGSAGASGEEPTNFTCTQVTGAMITGEWFDGGNFEDKLAALGGDPDKWEIKNNHYGTIEKWVNPTDGAIQTNDGDSYYWGKEPSSACAQNSNNPDRVIFSAISWELTEEAQWVEALEAVVQNIKDKYSNIRWIELVSHMRCPNNMMCNDNAVQG